VARSSKLCYNDYMLRNKARLPSPAASANGGQGKNGKAPIVISVGGSLIVPNEIDLAFLKSLKKMIEKGVGKGRKFIIITGGGKTARNYQNAAKKISNPSPRELDMIGIGALNLNAELVRILFRNLPQVSIYGAEKPGSSTDLGAVMLAKKFKTKKLINLSNIDYVYDRDPRIHADAKRIERIIWKEFRRIIPKKWDPGLNSPFDPVASREAEKIGLEVAIINGKKLEEIENFLSDKKFVGTLIR